jgi:hypothetical protein
VLLSLVDLTRAPLTTPLGLATTTRPKANIVVKKPPGIGTDFRDPARALKLGSHWYVGVGSSTVRCSFFGQILALRSAIGSHDCWG